MGLEVKIDDSVYQINKWFSVNGLTSNLDKINIIKFSSTNRKSEHINFRYLNIIKENYSLKFLGLQLDMFLN